MVDLVYIFFLCNFDTNVSYKCRLPNFEQKKTIPKSLDPNLRVEMSMEGSPNLRSYNAIKLENQTKQTKNVTFE